MMRVCSFVLLAVGALVATAGCKGAGSSKGTEGAPAASVASATPAAPCNPDFEDCSDAGSVGADDCLTLCRAFTRKRADCVDLFTKDLPLTPDQRAKVIADHIRTADGHECPSQCAFMAKTLIPAGKCASDATCAGFVACYKRGSQ